MDIINSIKGDIMKKQIGSPFHCAVGGGDGDGRDGEQEDGTGPASPDPGGDEGDGNNGD